MAKQNETLELTAADFKQEGIEVKITQNDLLEIIADRKFKEIIENIKKYSLKGVKDKYNVIYAKELAEQEEFKQTCVDFILQSHPDLKREYVEKKMNLSSKPIGINTTKYTYSPYLVIIEKPNGTVEVSNNGYSSVKSPSFSVKTYKLSSTITVDTQEETLNSFTKISSSQFYSFEKVMSVTSFNRKLKEVEKLEEETREVIKSIPGLSSSETNTVQLSFNKMLKDARIQMNSSIISSQSEVIKQSLKTNFQIEL